MNFTPTFVWLPIQRWKMIFEGSTRVNKSPGCYERDLLKSCDAIRDILDGTSMFLLHLLGNVVSCHGYLWEGFPSFCREVHPSALEDLPWWPHGRSRFSYDLKLVFCLILRELKWTITPPCSIQGVEKPLFSNGDRYTFDRVKESYWLKELTGWCVEYSLQGSELSCY